MANFRGESEVQVYIGGLAVEVCQLLSREGTVQ